MYDELYQIWKLELEKPELEKLPSDFYLWVADYMKRLKEESRMLDKKTLKSGLLSKEMTNAKRMVQGLIQVRYRKILGKALKGEEIQKDVLTAEEKVLYSRVFSLLETVQSFASEIIRGQVPKIKVETTQKRAVLRFVKDVPAIIGADVKTYGPFKAEDLASLPLENAKILITQGLAEKVETD